MTINTINAHNWAILYSGDSTTKIRRKNSFSSSVTKKLSGLETTKRKKNEELSYHKKILDFLTSHLTKNFAQLIGSALIENGRAVKKLILFWILGLLLLMFTILSWDALLSMQRQFLILKGSQNSFWNSWEDQRFSSRPQYNEELSNVLLAPPKMPHLTHCPTYYKVNPR